MMQVNRNILQKKRMTVKRTSKKQLWDLFMERLEGSHRNELDQPLLTYFNKKTTGIVFIKELPVNVKRLVILSFFQIYGNAARQE